MSLADNDWSDISRAQCTWWRTADLINEGGEKDMMGLYEVYVVDTKAKHVVTNDRVIAKDADKAKLSVAAKLSPQSEFPENLEFFVRCIGEWRDERPKEVKIVKEE